MLQKKLGWRTRDQLWFDLKIFLLALSVYKLVVFLEIFGVSNSNRSIVRKPLIHDKKDGMNDNSLHFFVPSLPREFSICRLFQIRVFGKYINI